ncbi:MAG: DUF2799 domain-containing protein [Woeseiaceae bacterium]|nr:DUF2799 domain-containing protein [Woeseiaceae bacterium]
MDKKWLNLAAAAVILGLSGCASMSANECALSDWSAIGYEDGSRGYSPDRFGQHRKACAKHGVAANFEDYQRGRTQGLREFCQPERAFSYGESGGRYNGVCPADLEGDFVAAYNSGYQLYTLRAAVNHANSAIYAAQSELDYAEKRIVAIGLELVAEETTTEQRVLLLAELKDTTERKGELKTEIEFLIAERARAEQELEYYEQTIAAARY